MEPDETIQNYWEVQQRLLDHANYVYQGWDSNRLTHDIAIWDAIDGSRNLYSDQGKLKEAEKIPQPCHGNLYADQGKLDEAEKMYQRALQGKEKAWGPDHKSTLDCECIHSYGIWEWVDAKTGR
ncbi:Pfs NB-ARC and TPR domain protein [Penicillium canariense]|uniref:Pfs NB-ARC and TPR domain protein n=1 Tax=Penicillium canariense TaxID=189055 RepID=A0A9W9HX78_9EURO|nr:Pfs NB-ARC and TPR domain protein [Penicillium canariense]KAJ5160672.1 Pfs NB-ARC and TPR domain protein [Penicillium canariense]